MDPQRLGLQSVQRVLLGQQVEMAFVPFDRVGWRFAWPCLSLKAVYKTADRPLR
jgi:hypothetical protein